MDCDISHLLPGKDHIASTEPYESWLGIVRTNADTVLLGKPY